MIGLEKHFDGVHAVNGVSLRLFPGEIVGVLGHNGAGKSCLMRILSGAMLPTGGEIRIRGKAVIFDSPIDARELEIETIYQTLALAEHLDAPANLFLGRELKTRFGNLDDARMLSEARKVLATLNPNFRNLTDPLSSPSETAMVADLIRRLKAQGIGILLVSHDMHDVFELCDRVVVMNKGNLVGEHDIEDGTKDDILSLIIKGELPLDWPPQTAEMAQ